SRARGHGQSDWAPGPDHQRAARAGQGLRGAARRAGERGGRLSDSPRPVAPEFLSIARVLAPHGIRGELKCAVLTDYPRRFATTRRVYLAGGGPSAARVGPLAVERARVQGHFVLLKLETIDRREAAERWRNAFVDVPTSERVRLPRGHYLWQDV